MGTHYFDPPQESLSNTDVIIKKLIEEYLRQYPLNIHNCEQLKKFINDALAGYTKSQCLIMNEKEERLRETVKFVCDSYDEKIRMMENKIEKLNQNFIK